MLKYDSLHGREQVKLLDERTVRKTAMSCGPHLVRCVERLCKILIAHPHPMIVPVYSFQIDEEPERASGDYTYSYDMLRLGMLNNDEKTLVSYLAYPNPCYDSYIERERKDYPSLVAFMEEMVRQDRYTDRHSGNVLKDEDGNYRIIDLEGFVRYPADTDANDWFLQNETIS